jgi:catechol 2,3-dioxygenase-like lactoylglutathione lyase family enzyme
MDNLRKSFAAVLMLCVAATLPAAEQASSPPGPHTLGAAKLIIGDVKTNQAFYQQMFGMKEVAHYSADGVYDEPIMGFGDGARLALFSPVKEAALQKSQYPVALVYTTQFDTVVKRIQDAKHPIQRLPPAASGPYRIAIARDPSGNAIEILARDNGSDAVGGAKLIVADRQKAEDFFVQVFGAKPVQRFNTAAYDEVLLAFNQGFVALFQPKNEEPLPKSQFPVVALYTTEFDAVLERVRQIGLGYRDVKTSTGSRIIIAKDPSGNGVEIIAR